MPTTLVGVGHFHHFSLNALFQESSFYVCVSKRVVFFLASKQMVYGRGQETKFTTAGMPGSSSSVVRTERELSGLWHSLFAQLHHRVVVREADICLLAVPFYHCTKIYSCFLSSCLLPQSRPPSSPPMNA